ncbi:MAG: DNA translocase FtsK 4TM domain-containing protein [Fimbriimonadaceae bacterium]|nr:DNA translocase FtsK 4TM domain-containing protein [Fimbriimonadaceae bacterium]
MATRANRNSKPVESSHRHGDVAGVVLVAVALIMTIALGLGNAGVIGNALGSVFSTLFGRAAWAAPVALLILGATGLLGRRQFEVGRLSWGVACLFLTLVGSMASSQPRGDYFDPLAAQHSGGYIGAIIGWAFDTLLGQAKPVGLGALGMVGVILCVNSPLHMIMSSLTSRRKKPAQRISLPVTERAAVRMPVVNEVEEESPGPAPRKATIIHKAENPFTLQPTPKDKEGYKLPPLTLLNQPPPKQRRSAQEMQANIETLERTLEEFGIEANVTEVATGPTITRYEIQLGPGVNVRRITNLGDNIAMNLAAAHVRVEAPIPGKAAVGVEVPNSQPAMVGMREVCETNEFLDGPNRLIVALGQDVSGNNRYADLSKMPHLLIGGATNSGKSIGLASIITSLLLRNTPKDVRLVMIDPKRVELTLFDGIPHLMCPVVKDITEAPGVLRAVWREMDMRYDRLSEIGVRNIDGYNAQASFQDKMPYIVVIIDELADLMIQAAAEVETSIVRLAQLARAVGIHLVIATQRPSVDVITGTIKANIPSRMAFAVSSQIDSRTILDGAGAERLVGKGDMLFMPIDANKPTRMQGCYVGEKEIEAVCEFWREQEAPQYVLDPISIAVKEREREVAEEAHDELWQEVVTFVVDRQEASTSMIQRKFSIGFQRASRLLDMMEDRGIVGPRVGARSREVLVSPMEVEAVLSGRRAGPPVEIDPFED